ncbi:MAG TPA: class IV adenylate cyclase [Candidatus Paceibacterota bacterium]|nr:class IV adenylate cyclase [Candidatus Paceibacterota bacterium]
MTNNKEIEVRLQLDDPKPLFKFLKKSAEFLKTSNQIDFYFDLPDRTFTYIDSKGYKNADEWLRVRISDKNSLCYKKWHRDKNTGRSLYADETELYIDNGKGCVTLLENLGFKKICVIEKHRESWKYSDFQFDCDKVKGLGFFVEIEFMGKIDDPTKGREKIFDLLENIGIKNWKVIKGGYPWMVWNKDKNLFEDD